MPILIPMNANPVPPVPSASGTLASLAAGTNPVGSTLGASTAGPYGAPYAAPNFGVATPSATYAPPVFSTPAVMPAAAPTLSNLTPLTSATSVPRQSSATAATSSGSPLVDQMQADEQNHSGLWGTITHGLASAINAPAQFALHLFGQGDDVPDSDTLEQKVNARYSDILGQFGASPDFIRQAQNQFRLAWQVQAGEDGLDAPTVNALAGDVLNGMIGEWQRQQSGVSNDPYGDARRQLEQDRQAQMAQIAATQSWMQPMIQQQLGRANSDAGAYTQAGLALANQVTDPAMSAALSQLARSYSSDQSTANALMMQQAQLAPQSLQAQMDAQYQSQLQDLALQEAQYNQDTLASGGTLPGQAPIIGGIPLAPLPPAVAAGAPVIDAGAGAYPPGYGPNGQSPGNTSGNTLAQAGPDITRIASSLPPGPAPGGMPGIAPFGPPSTPNPAALPSTTMPGQAVTGSMMPDPASAALANPARGGVVGALSSGPVMDVNGQQVNVNAMWQQVLAAGGRSSPTTDYYANQLAQAAGTTPQAVLQFAQQDLAAQSQRQSSAPPPPTTPTAVGPAGDITAMFDSWGPERAQQWYTANSASLSQREREQAQEWIKNHVPQNLNYATLPGTVPELPPPGVPMNPSGGP